ncbi:hypothetical protein ACHAXT_011639 [Thalassiosira profunda]
MKRTLLLSMAACAGAQLRGAEEGVEEVSAGLEHFAPDLDEYAVDRRILVEGDADDVDLEATMAMEEYFDEYADVDVMGNEVEEFDEDWVDPDHVPKEYAPEEGLTMLDDTLFDVAGEEFPVVDQRDRREAACGQGKSEFKMMIFTDNYGYETKWALYRGQTRMARGPPANSKYADKKQYNGRWCLPAGNYRLQLMDMGRDGMCTGGQYGCGRMIAWKDGAIVAKNVQDRSKWGSKSYRFAVMPGSSRIDGVPPPAPSPNNNNNNNSGGQWCRKVRSVMGQPHRGTCRLPNGQQGHRVKVSTKVDKYGQETSWRITRNGQVKMKMAAIVPANGQKAVEDCLPPGQYQFEIMDLDGICCRHGQGKYVVSADNKPLFDGGAFVKREAHKFTLGYDWLSSMSERDCEWWWAHDYRRRDWHTRCYSGQYCNKTYRHLKWSSTLKQHAQVYANKLLDTCDDTGIKHDQTDQGENLAKNKGKGNWGQKYPADKVTKRFVDNEEFWGWNRNAHLTQAMWRATRYMGCAESVKDMGGGKLCRMQVCRYAKAGNCMMGKYNSHIGKNWMKPVFADDSPCGPMCPPGQGGCHN